MREIAALERSIKSGYTRSEMIPDNWSPTID